MINVKDIFDSKVKAALVKRLPPTIKPTKYFYGGNKMLRMKQTIKNIVSGFLAAVMTMGAIPAISVSAAQANEYVDPADVWMEANGRINELDINATTTYETSFCPVCNMDTTLLIYRVPEYTRTGETALNRNVKFSDGTCLDGVSVGNCDSGTPGVDASYTGHHWSATRS